jgi:hypothetical protein
VATVIEEETSTGAGLVIVRGLFMALCLPVCVAASFAAGAAFGADLSRGAPQERPPVVAPAAAAALPADESIVYVVASEDEMARFLAGLRSEARAAAAWVPPWVLVLSRDTSPDSAAEIIEVTVVREAEQLPRLTVIDLRWL